MRVHHQNPVAEVIMPPPAELTAEEEAVLAVRYETELQATLNLAFFEGEPTDPLQRSVTEEAEYPLTDKNIGLVSLAINPEGTKVWLFARRPDQPREQAREVLVLSLSGIYECQHPGPRDARQNTLLNIFVSCRDIIAGVR